MSIQSNFPNLKPSLLLDFANTKQLDNRVTFTRSTPAVYYDGKTTAMAEQNLLLQSQNFNTGWALTLSVSSTTATAPDGTSTAYQFSGASTAYFTQTNSGIDGNNPFTYSIYVKAGSVGTVRLAIYRLSDGTNAYVDFNTSAGTIVGSGGPYASTSSITSVGNSWYRCVVSVATMGTGSTGLGVVVYQQSGSSGNFYAWGAQLEQRSSATAYTPTTTQPITNYIPVLLTAGGNQPRFDCNPTTGESLGLLIEEQRTNLALYSQAFGNWSIGNASVQSDCVIAPDGTQTGDWIIGATAGERVTQDIVISSTNCTFSVYVKATNWNFTGCTLLIRNSTTSTNLLTVRFSGSAFTPDSGSGTSTSVGNGWYRLSVPATSGITSGNTITFYIYTDNVSGANSNNTVFAWGAQVEAASFATSYIATTSASATRTADNASMTGTNFSSWFNAGEGTFFTNFKTVASTNFPQVVSVTDNTTANTITIDAQSGIRAFLTVNNINPAYFTASYLAGDNLVSLGYKANDFGASFNNATTVTDTSGNLPSVFQMWIGQLYSNSNALNGTIKKIAYYPIKISSTNLQALTS